jgi:hypothetical protein
MTDDDYGKQINLAVRAVQQMHSDCSRLLLDFDRQMEGWSPVFGSYATRDLTYNVRALRWMAEGVYRLYTNQSLPSLVRGLTISFIENDTDRPLLLVGELRYSDRTSEIKAVCKEWDLWGVFFDWGGQRVYDELLSFTAPDPNKRIDLASLIAKPLYSINSVEEIAELMKRVATPHGHSKA